MKKKILATLLALATMATSMVIPAMAKVVTTVDEVLYETNFENFTALADGNAAGIKTWGGWTVDEAAGFSGKGGFIATGVNNNDRNINILASGEIIEDGVVEITAKYYPSAYTNKIMPSRSYNANYDHDFTLPTDLERKWYDLDVIMDLDGDTATVTLSADGEEAYTATKSYTYGFRELRVYVAKTSGNWTNDNTARIDDLKIAKVTKTEEPDEPAEPPVVEEPEVEIPEGEEKIYFNNFNKATDNENGIYYGITCEDGSLSGYEVPIMATWADSTITTGLSGNGATVIHSGDTRDFELAIPAMSAGVCKLTYDFYPSAGKDEVNLARSYNSWAGRTAFMSVSGLERKWYKVEIIVDLDNNTATGTIKDGQAVVYTKTISYTYNLLIFEFSRTVSGGTKGDNASKAAVFDNMLATEVLFIPEPEEPEVEIPAGEEKVYFNDFNFDTLADNEIYYSALGEGKLNDGYTAPVISSWMTGGIVPGFEGNGFALQMANKERDIEVVIPSASEGTYKLTYDFYPSTGTDRVNISPSMNSWSNRVKVLEVSGLERKWYKGEVIVNIDTHTATATLKDADGTQVYTNTITYNAGLVLFEFVRIVDGGTTGDNVSKAPILDNLLVTKLKAEPIVTLKDKAGVEVTDLTAVNPVLGSIEIDFSEAMDEATLSEETVTVKAGDNAVAMERSYADGVYTLVPNAALATATEYEVSITSDALYADGNKVKDYTFKFTTKASTAAEDSGVPAGEEKIYFNDFNFNTWSENGIYYGILGEGKLNDGYTAPVISSWMTGTEMVAGYEGNGFPLQMANETRDIELVIPEISKGVCKLTYDFYPSAGTDVVNLSASMTSWAGRKELLKVSGLERKWYKGEIIVNFDKDTATATLKDEAGNQVYTNSIAYDSSLVVFEFSRTVSGGTAGGNASKAPVLDNLLVTKLKSEPVVTITGKSGTVEKDLTAVNPAVGNITINFGEAVNEETLTDTSVTLKAGSSVVAMMRSYADGIYTLVPTTKLSPLTEYELSVTSDVLYLDNNKVKAYTLKFTTKESENDIPEMNDNIIYATDFENFTASDGTVVGIKTWGGWTVDEAAGFEGKGGFIATGTSTTARNINILASETRLNDGVVKMTAKYYPSESTNQIRVSRSYNNNYDHVFTVPADLERKWYDLEIVVDMDNDVATVTLSADGEVAYTENKAYTLGFIEFNIFQNRASGSWTNDNTARVDDIVVERIYSTAPVVTDASVVILAADVAQTDYKAVSSLTDTVAVNFGQPVKSAYLNDEYIYVEKLSDSTKVPYTASFANNTYTMVFDELLEANTDYKLVVKEVENLSGLKTEAYEKSFTVGKAVLSATLKGITQLTFPVTTVAGLTKGEDATIEIDYKNSKNEDTTLYLVVAYYSGNKLLKAEYVTKDVAKEVTAATYKFNYEVPAASELSGYDSVKVMMWNGFSSMIPLSQSIELK